MYFFFGNDRPVAHTRSRMASNDGDFTCASLLGSFLITCCLPSILPFVFSHCVPLLQNHWAKFNQTYTIQNILLNHKKRTKPFLKKI